MRAITSVSHACGSTPVSFAVSMSVSSVAALSPTGEVFALSRALNAKARQIRDRLGDESSLPRIADVRRAISERMTAALRHHIKESREGFQRNAATLDHAKMVMTHRHRHERERLRRRQQARMDAEAEVRARRIPKGLRKLWAWASGSLSHIQAINTREADEAARRDRLERERLVEKQLGERQPLQQRIQALRARQAQQLAELRRDVGRYIRLGRVPEDAHEQRRRSVRTRRHDRHPKLKR